MALLSLVYAPNPIFKQKAEPVAAIDDSIRTLVADMFETMAFEQAVGMGANMVGVLKRVIVVDLRENDISSPMAFINPEIVWQSDDMQEYEEASLCFVGISAHIRRPRAITLRYLDMDGNTQEMQAEGFLSSVIQHEIDYLNGVTFPDHLSKMKRDMLLKKMHKHLKHHPPHVHGAGCNH